MKQFTERLICYAQWPWGQPIPKMRNKKKQKKALLMTSSACPAFIGRIAFGGTFRTLKACADCLGAATAGKLYFGKVAIEADTPLSEPHKQRALRAGRHLVQ